MTSFDPVNSDGLARHLVRAASTDDPEAVFDAETWAEQAWVAEHQAHFKPIIQRILDRQRAQRSVI